MAFQETVTTGYGQRLSGGFGGIWQGLLLIIGATVAIWWNEGRAVKTADAIKDAKGAAVEMTDNSTINPQFEGKLIHTMGMLTCDETIADQQFGVQVQGAIRIARSVEYYQWVEHSESHTEDKVGGSQETTTTYTYDKQWVSSPVESADFHDPDYKSVNTVITSVPNERFRASRVKLGAYNLNSAQISGFSNGANLPISVPEETLAQLQQKYSANFQADSTGNKPQVVSTSGNVIYIGQSAAAPQIGDVRISYVTHMPTTVSVVCQVCGDTFTDYLADNGERCRPRCPNVPKRRAEQHHPHLGAPHHHYHLHLQRLQVTLQLPASPHQLPPLPLNHPQLWCQTGGRSSHGNLGWFLDSIGLALLPTHYLHYYISRCGCHCLLRHQEEERVLRRSPRSSSCISSTSIRGSAAEPKPHTTTVGFFCLFVFCLFVS